MFSYDGKRFRAEGDGPVVTYRQDRDLLYAEIPPGGRLRRGSLTGVCAADGTLDFAYSMVFDDGTVVSGFCHSIPARRPDGGIRLREEWERYGPNAATGVSYLEEVLEPAGAGAVPGGAGSGSEAAPRSDTVAS